MAPKVCCGRCRVLVSGCFLYADAVSSSDKGDTDSCCPVEAAKLGRNGKELVRAASSQWIRTKENDLLSFKVNNGLKLHPCKLAT
ncbi:hypothetical protein XENOCAPTIV_016004 [Xenoophorus captivus]|uniref:Secreted protein n=1 Tax=Xenoophorus captivus TaxID=1517983 RepID=A0ABV0RKW9_9TELE